MIILPVISGPKETFLSDYVAMMCGDCLERMRELPDNSVDSAVSDPPYGLKFMGKYWDHGVPGVEYWREVLRVLKPGAHLLAFGGTRTYHRMACAVEDAGFEIRDAVQWLYGSGYPKNQNLSKAIDAHFGAQRKAIGSYVAPDGKVRDMHLGMQGGNLVNSQNTARGDHVVTAPATPEAIQWDGWGIAFKPACELVVLARKPISENTIHENVLKWGTGGLNIDACRVPGTKPATTRGAGGRHGRYGPLDAQGRIEDDGKGRYPSNVIHDGSPDVLDGFPDTQPSKRAARGGTNPNPMDWGNARSDGDKVAGHDDDGGSAGRFFYTAKADDYDRMTSDHPTVKPVDLMQYLSRLVTPRGGLILDPFAGTGTTGEAAWREGFRCVLIEREPKYQEHIRTRMKLAFASDRERRVAVQVNKVKTGRKKVQALPLFAENGA